MKKLSRTEQKIFDKNFFGFDIETYDDNKGFLLASIVGVTREGFQYERVFYTPEDVVKELKTNNVFKDSVLFATNLAFDFFGTFFGHEESTKFITVFRGSSLLFTRTYYGNNGFTPLRESARNRKTRKSLCFIDSLNYAQMSVKQMGEVVGYEKLETPSWIGRYPETHDQWVEMERYNVRDSWVTFKFMEFFINAVESLGATFKYTIASTSLSLFKNKYLGEYEVFQPDTQTLLEIFKAYYGGRTEAFKRGSFGKTHYYDFNSLYPSVMHDFEYPDPNSMRKVYNVDDRFIIHYEGVSDVDVTVPFMNTPPLPVRLDDGKVVFPFGKIRGWYSHVELRHAVKHGCTVERVRTSIYYTRTVRPFKQFITDMYNLRMKYKRERSPMQLVVKILMNSSYGKFGEKFVDKSTTMHESVMTREELDKLDHYERIGDYITYKEDFEPKSHCVPIWAVYVTAYGRIKMFDTLKDHDPVYCDTDSIITTHELPESNELGELKCEMEISEGLTVRPKFYAIRNDDEQEVKIKGVKRRLSWYEFTSFTDAYRHFETRMTPLKPQSIPIDQSRELEVTLVSYPYIYYSKFAKFKESLRRGFTPNEVFTTRKHLSLEDSKRDWSGKKFDPQELQESKPLNVEMF